MWGAQPMANMHTCQDYSSHIPQPITPTVTALVASRPIELHGSGFDLNDGVLDGTSLRWASDRQGPLGIGQQ